MINTKTISRGKPAIGAWPELVARRRELGHSQTDAAAAIGVPQQTFSDWESGKKEPSRDIRGSIADYLGITRAELAVSMAKIFS